MVRNWSVSCEKSVSILFLALASGMKVGFQSFWYHPIRAFESYMGGFEKVKLNVSSYISFVPVDAAVMIRQFDILHVVEVRYACLGQVI